MSIRNEVIKYLEVVKKRWEEKRDTADKAIGELSSAIKQIEGEYSCEEEIIDMLQATSLFSSSIHTKSKFPTGEIRRTLDRLVRQVRICVTSCGTDSELYSLPGEKL